jgi:hypothetical protein
MFDASAGGGGTVPEDGGGLFREHPTTGQPTSQTVKHPLKTPPNPANALRQASATPSSNPSESSAAPIQPYCTPKSSPRAHL